MEKDEMPLFNSAKGSSCCYKVQLLLWRAHFSAGSLRGVLFSPGVPIVVVFISF